MIRYDTTRLFQFAREEERRDEEKYFVNHDEGWPLEYLFVSSKGIGVE